MSVQSSFRNRTQQGAPAEGFFRVGPLMELPALVRDLGCDPDPIFDSAGFNLAQFLDPSVEIPGVPGSRLLARCVTATECEHLGLLLGERATLESLGVAGVIPRTAPDVGTALRGLVRRLDLHDRGAAAFPTRWLDHPIASADPLLHRHLEEEVYELRADQQTSLASKLRELRRRSLAIRNGRVAVIARELGMHERTLNRRLRAEGTTFRRELESIRYEVARRLLAETKENR